MRTTGHGIDCNRPGIAWYETGPMNLGIFDSFVVSPVTVRWLTTQHSLTPTSMCIVRRTAGLGKVQPKCVFVREIIPHRKPVTRNLESETKDTGKVLMYEVPGSSSCHWCRALYSHCVRSVFAERQKRQS
jgi:hypothetical protein